jgi:multiple sugar transport system substrate-binding protein
MTIEGNWIAGAMTHDYPTVKYKALQLPTGPGGNKGTLQYDGGWGMAAASKNKADAMSLITYLTSPKVQMGNAKAFGVMPSVKANAKEWSKLYPQFAAFLAGADYSKSIPTVPDIATVLGDFNQQLQGLPQTDAKTILDRINGELQSVLNKQ